MSDTTNTVVAEKPALTRASLEQQQRDYKASCKKHLDSNLAEYRTLKERLGSVKADIQEADMPGFGTPAGVNPVNVVKSVPRNGGAMKVTDIAAEALKWGCEAVNSQAKVEKVLHKGSKDKAQAEGDKGNSAKAWSSYNEAKETRSFIAK